MIRRLYGLFNIGASVLAAVVFGFNTVRSVAGDHPAGVTALLLMLTGLCIWLAAISVAEVRDHDRRRSE